MSGSVIRTRADLAEWLAADLRAHGLTRWRLRDRFDRGDTPRIVRFQRKMRLLEYLTNVERVPLRWRCVRRLIWWRYSALSVRLGFTVPINTFGPGLRIAHRGTLVVHHNARIGSNCEIHPSTSVGGRDDARVPSVGANAYIGPGARLVGAVTLGDDIIIGANAVVTRSFGDGAVLVGAPARAIRYETGAASN